jgi:hypothetical protein
VGCPPEIPVTGERKNIKILAGCGKRGVDERSFLSQWPVQGYLA